MGAVIVGKFRGIGTVTPPWASTSLCVGSLSCVEHQPVFIEEFRDLACHGPSVVGRIGSNCLDDPLQHQVLDDHNVGHIKLRSPIAACRTALAIGTDDQAVHVSVARKRFAASPQP